MFNRRIYGLSLLHGEMQGSSTRKAPRMSKEESVDDEDWDWDNDFDGDQYYSEGSSPVIEPNNNDCSNLRNSSIGSVMFDRQTKHHVERDMDDDYLSIENDEYSKKNSAKNESESKNSSDDESLYWKKGESNPEAERINNDYKDEIQKHRMKLDFHDAFLQHVKDQLLIKYSASYVSNTSQNALSAEERKKQLHNHLRDFFSTVIMPESKIQDLLSIFRTDCPEVADILPTKIDRKGWLYKEDFGDQMAFVYDCCPNGHIVYAAANRNLSVCPICLKLKDCADKKQVQYLSLILLICHLLQSSLNFVDYLQYTVESMFESSEKKFYSDGFRHGSVPKMHLNEMHEIFQLYKSDKQRESHTSAEYPIEEISLLFGFAYDGVQVYKSRSAYFWPMLLSILNLPPNCRNTNAIGLFTISVVQVAPGSPAELFVFDLFVQELIRLYEGFEISIDGKNYFIQGRLVLHIYDTKAVEDVCKLQVVGALAGCPFCHLIRG